MKKTVSKTKRIILWSLAGLLLILFAGYGEVIYQLCHFNSDMVVPDNGQNLVASFHMKNGIVQGFYGTPFKVDTGSRHCFLTTKTIKKIRDKGWEVKESPTFIITTDNRGYYRLYTRKVVVNLFLPSPDSPGGVIEIKNVECLISDRSEGNVFGMDFLSHFCMEHTYTDNILNLYRTPPAEYVPVGTLSGSDSWVADLVGYSKRMGMTLSLNNQPEKVYFMDTGVEFAKLVIVQPLADTITAHTAIRRGPDTGFLYQDDCWVDMGNRHIVKTVVYDDELSAKDYTINPINFFTQDFLLDFPGRRVMLHTSAPHNQHMLTD